jgi:hypothetical protein
MTTAVELVIAAEPDAWRAAGFEVGDDGTCVLGDIGVRLIGGSGGMTAWVLADAPDPAVTDIDGLATAHAAIEHLAAAPAHPNGVTSIDHVVVYTPDLERTCAAIEAATAAPLKRIREAGSIRQGFHRLGSLIVEVVTHPGVTGEHAEFWGLALNAEDLDALYARCGDAAMSAPKDAVQPGRRIASFREAAGLGLPVAVMTPHVRR